MYTVSKTENYKQTLVNSFKTWQAAYKYLKTARRLHEIPKDTEQLSFEVHNPSGYEMKSMCLVYSGYHVKGNL
jgi:hypothetical protein